jgi:hypothetical protein
MEEKREEKERTTCSSAIPQTTEASHSLFMASNIEIE